MGFRVPWRCLVPEDAVEAVFGEDGGRGVEQATGVHLHISGEGDAPETLSDKIVTLEGTAPQKEEACRMILKDLWTSQGIPADEEGIFVLVVPSKVVGAIIGTKGAKVNEIMGSSGADLNVGRECIIGMPDNPVVIKGTQEQALTATAMSHVVLQELADRGRLEPGDFRWVPGRAAEAPRPAPRSGFGASPAARFRFASGVAGFVIGKGGLKIKRLKEESGALLQFRSAEEEPALALAEDERVLEVRGAPGQRNQAVRALFLSLDEMPDPPRGTRLLVPTTLERAALEEMSAASGVELTLGKDTRLGSPEPGEVTAELQGPAPARLEVVLNALGLMDARAGVAGDGGPGPAPRSQGEGAVSRPSFAEPAPSGAAPPGPPASAGVRPFQQAEPREERPAPAPAPGRAQHHAGEVERRVEPESGKAFTFEEFKVAFAGTYTEDEIRDYWRDACKPVPPGAAAREAMPAGTGDAPEATAGGMCSGQQGVALPNGQDERRQDEREQLERARRERELREQQEREQELQQRLQQQEREQREQRERQQREERERQQREQREREQHEQRQREDREGEQREREQQERERNEREQQQQQQQSQALQPYAQPPPSHSKDLGACGARSAEPCQQQIPCSASFCGSFAPFCSMQGFGMNTNSMGWNASMFGVASPMFASPQSQLHLLLPAEIVRRVLVPSGQLAEIARGCNIRIDLCEEVSPDQLHVMLSGTCVANSLATVALQGRIWFAQAALAS